MRKFALDKTFVDGLIPLMGCVSVDLRAELVGDVFRVYQGKPSIFMLVNIAGLATVFVTALG